MELLGVLSVVGMLGGVYALLLKSPSAGARRRRLRLLDGRRRDRDPFDGSAFGAALLSAVALGDLATTAEGVGPGATFGVGLLLSAALAFEGVRPLVYLLVGVSALLNTVLGLVFGDACGGALSGAQRLVVLAGTGAFLAAVVGCRLVFAPLRARGLRQASAFLALYGVVTTAAYAAQLHRLGALSDWGWRAYGIVALCLLALALGTAVQPVFAMAVLGVAIAALAFFTDGTAGCLEVIPLVGVLVGFTVGRMTARALGRAH